MGESFNSPINSTIFSLGSFTLTTNFLSGDEGVNYGGELVGFSSPITLEKLGVDDNLSTMVFDKDNQIKLNLDYSNLESFVRFGSTREYLRYCVENIINKYPASIHINSMLERGSNITFFDYSYDEQTNESTFKIPSSSIENPFGLSIDKNNNEIRNGNPLTNIGVSYNKFCVSKTDNIDEEYQITSFTGDSEYKDYLDVTVEGNPFYGIGDSGRINYHIKPLKKYFKIFRFNLHDFEKHIISKRDNLEGFVFTLKRPTELDDGKIIYTQNVLRWPTGDGYNIDISGSNYNFFLNTLLNYGEAYDSIKTDIIYNMLVPKSLLTYDLTEEKKLSKLLRIYGHQIDKIRVFIDSLLYIYNLSYDKIKNTPDRLLNGLSKSFGWEDLYIQGEDDLVKQIFSNQNTVSEVNDYENINIELWRRILINTNHFWKSKGTRESIMAIFALLGLPEEFINFNEYIYTADGKINPNSVNLTDDDFPTKKPSYDLNGFPKVPPEDSNFYFQISGTSDNGQRYMDVFRKVGFDIYPEIDNIKTVVVENNDAIGREIDNRLIINTKTVDLNLDASKVIEDDFNKYIREIDYPANEEGHSLLAAYINVSLESENPNIFELPPSPIYDFNISDLEVRFDGVLMTENEDYVFSGETPTYLVLLPPYLDTPPNIVQVTYLRATEDVEEFINELDVKYVVQKIIPDVSGTIITLPEIPKGEIQMTVNGIALTQGNTAYSGDYMFIGENRIHLFNTALITYLSSESPYVVISYLTYTPNENVDVEGFELRSESIRYFGVNTSKFYITEYNGLERFAYKLNYKVGDEKNVKILVDGLSIKPFNSENPDDPWDYKINKQNGELDENYEIILNVNKIAVGTVITAYYLVGEDVLNLIIPGIDPKKPFFEFLDLLETKLIDVRLRKIITDYSTGWYPQLFKIYVDYLRRSELEEESPLISNGYIFNNTFNFLKKHGLSVSTFMGFAKQLLPATAIINKEGILVRNTIFTKQKHTYRRGVSFNSEIPVYWGDDGSYFKKEFVTEQHSWMDEYIIPEYDPETNSGYFGIITAAEFIDGDTLLNFIFEGEIPGDDLENSDEGWLKFYYEDKFLFISKKPLIKNISWDEIYDSGLVYGTNDFGPYNSGQGVLQDKKITINGIEYIVRLIKGGKTNPTSVGGGEWDHLICRIHEDDPLNYNDKLWDSFTDADLGVNIANGGATWCQEAYSEETNKRILRGDGSVELMTEELSSENANLYGYRPVLELIEPWK